MPRLFISPAAAVLASGALRMPPATARHVRVLRLGFGDAVTVFDGTGGEWEAELADADHLQLHRHLPLEREAAVNVHLAIGMPANDRMDALIEKAVELGATSIQPLQTQRSVLRLQGDRAAKRVAHWQAVAVAACEQCGRNRVPEIAPVRALDDWIRDLPQDDAARCLLGPRATAPLQAFAPGTSAWMVSGPEGGLSLDEEAALERAGFQPVSLGPRVLRADTAPLAALVRATGA